MKQEVFGLVGKKLGHSFSKKFFTQKFDLEFVNSTYLNYELNSITEIERLREIPELKGFNVTIPYKELILNFLDEINGVANQIGAVNTVKIDKGRWIGYNSDVFGFRQMIKPFFKSHHEKAIILGTGGASKSVAYVLEEIGAEVIYISRNPSKEFEFSYDEVNAQMINSCKLIVNTSPVGTFPNNHELINIPYEYIDSKHLVVDLIYNPEKTRFLEEAEKRGAWILNGKTMLEQQAEESWRIWNS